LTFNLDKWGKNTKLESVNWFQYNQNKNSGYHMMLGVFL
jgi:hypothetical protein